MFVSCRFTFFKSFIRRNSTSIDNGIRQFDACTGCEIPCSKHVAYPSKILAQIDQSTMKDSVEKHRRHLCIAQNYLPSQWPKDVKHLEGNYLKELTRIFNKNKDAIGYTTKLTSASISSKDSSSPTNADWYLFPDQLKISNVNIEQIDEVVEKLFVENQSNIETFLPKFSDRIQCERLTGLWILVCCHFQRDERCGIIGPILVDEIEKHVRQTNQTGNIHCLKISHIGGHRFAGNVIIYPSGTWYGRILTCHIPLLINAYTSSSKDLKEKLKPLLRGSVETESSPET